MDRRKTKELLWIQEIIGTILHSFQQVDDADLNNWQGIMYGPENSPYEGGMFQFTLTFPEYFPFVHPTIKFATPIFHPNIGLDGKICIPIFDDAWEGAIKLKTCFEIIDEVFKNPIQKEEYSVNIEAGCLYAEDRAKFEQTAQKWTQKYGG